MSEAADRRIAELEMHIKDLERRCENQVGIMDRDRRPQTDEPVAPPDDEDVP